VPVFEIPDALPLDDGALEVEVASLGDAALSELLAAADPQSSPHPVVAKALLELADSLRVGERYDAVTFDAGANGSRRRVRVDGVVRQRLRRYVESLPAPPARSDALVGVLVEADFEKRTARLRTATDPAVTVTFDEDLADDIQLALRQQATLRGEVMYDQKTNVARSVRLQRLERGQQLVLGLDPEEFWRVRDFDELARLQGAGDPVDPEDLYDADATDEERDAFMAAIAELD
jgi:hypothetical protein